MGSTSASSRVWNWIRHMVLYSPCSIWSKICSRVRSWQASERSMAMGSQTLDLRLLLPGAFLLLAQLEGRTSSSGPAPGQLLPSLDTHQQGLHDLGLLVESGQLWSWARNTCSLNDRSYVRSVDGVHLPSVLQISSGTSAVRAQIRKVMRSECSLQQRDTPGNSSRDQLPSCFISQCSVRACDIAEAAA